MIDEIKAEYSTGQVTIKQLAEKYSVSSGKMYYMLRNAGCAFIRKRRKPVSEAERERRSIAQKGKVISDAQRKAISERNSCNYNGLNGFGHIKRHNKGYLLAYVPKHPKAHKDGYLQLHTVVMENYIGRYLTDNEEVHHINHIRDDNRVENLMLMDKHKHRSMHMKERHEKRRNDLSIA